MDPLASVAGGLMNGGGGYSYTGPSSEAAAKNSGNVMKTVVFGGSGGMPSLPMSSSMKIAALVAVVAVVWLWKR